MEISIMSTKKNKQQKGKKKLKKQKSNISDKF